VSAARVLHMWLAGVLDDERAALTALAAAPAVLFCSASVRRAAHAAAAHAAEAADAWCLVTGALPPVARAAAPRTTGSLTRCATGAGVRRYCTPGKADAEVAAAILAAAATVLAPRAAAATRWMRVAYAAGVLAVPVAGSGATVQLAATLLPWAWATRGGVWSAMGACTSAQPANQRAECVRHPHAGGVLALLQLENTGVTAFVCVPHEACVLRCRRLTAHCLFQRGSCAMASACCGGGAAGIVDAHARCHRAGAGVLRRRRRVPLKRVGRRLCRCGVACGARATQPVSRRRAAAAATCPGAPALSSWHDGSPQRP
jgi:hypothetical protein